MNKTLISTRKGVLNIANVKTMNQLNDINISIRTKNELIYMLNWLLNMVTYYVQKSVRNVVSHVNLMAIMKTIVNPLKSYGFVENAMALYIEQKTLITLNDLTRRLRKEMRKSKLYGDIEREIRRGFPAVYNNGQ